MANIVLLSCTKSKTDHAAPAQELYSASPMFRKTLEYGKKLQPDKMFILSAKHHLVPLDQKLAPYDLTLKDMKADEKAAWGEKVISQMRAKGINPEKDTFTFLTGSEYMKPLTGVMKNVETPLANKKFGERLKWLNGQLGEAIKYIKNLIHEVISKRFK
jgi:hypothetical protein